ncbi:hypothetical protein ACQKE5_10430 [Paenisporosarcina sp. NPDC076898]
MTIFIRGNGAAPKRILMEKPNSRDHAKAKRREDSTLDLGII